MRVATDRQRFAESVPPGRRVLFSPRQAHLVGSVASKTQVAWCMNREPRHEVVPTKGAKVSRLGPGRPKVEINTQEDLRYFINTQTNIFSPQTRASPLSDVSWVEEKQTTLWFLTLTNRSE